MSESADWSIVGIMEVILKKQWENKSELYVN